MSPMQNIHVISKSKKRLRVMVESLSYASNAKCIQCNIKKAHTFHYVFYSTLTTKS